MISKLLVGEAAAWAKGGGAYPRRPELLSSLSKAVAIEMAAGFTCRTACNDGFKSSMRAR